jgi:hypothetical protein
MYWKSLTKRADIDCPAHLASVMVSMPNLNWPWPGDVQDPLPRLQSATTATRPSCPKEIV